MAHASPLPAASHISMSSDSDTLTLRSGLAATPAVAHPGAATPLPLSSLPMLNPSSSPLLDMATSSKALALSAGRVDDQQASSRASAVPAASDRQQRIHELLRELAPSAYSTGTDALSNAAVHGSSRASPEPVAWSASSRYDTPGQGSTSGLYTDPSSAAGTPFTPIRSPLLPVEDCATATVLNYEAVMETPPVGRPAPRPEQAAGSAPGSSAGQNAAASTSQPPDQVPGAYTPQVPSVLLSVPTYGISFGPASQRSTQPSDSNPPAVAAPATSPASPAMGFHFGQQHVYVSGPPMHQHLELHPDGTLTTIHSPFPPGGQLPSSPRQATPEPSQFGLESHSGLSPAPPVSPRTALARLTAGEGVDSEVQAKYKKAKRLLQVQLLENDSLRQQLAAEARRAAAMEARAAPWGSITEVSTILASAQAERLVVVSQLQETSAQLESERAAGRVLQAQVASAEADKQQLLEAFIKERAKREAEALAARRVLESKFDAAESRREALEQQAAAQGQQASAAQAKAAELAGQVTELQEAAVLLQLAKQRLEEEVQVQKQASAGGSAAAEREHRQDIDELRLQHSSAIASLAQQHEQALKQQIILHEQNMAGLEEQRGRVLNQQAVLHEQAVARMKEQLEQVLNQQAGLHEQTVAGLKEQHEQALSQQAVLHEQTVAELEEQHQKALSQQILYEQTIARLQEQLTLQVELCHVEEHTVRAQCAEADDLSDQLTQALAKIEDCNTRLQQEAEQHLREVQSLKEQHGVTLAEVMGRHEQELRQQAQQHEQAVTRLQEQLHLQVELCHVEEHTVRAQCAEADDLSDQLKQALATIEDCNTRLQQEAEQHLREVQSLKEQHREALAEVTGRHEQELRQQAEQHEQRMRQQAEQHALSLRQVAKEHESMTQRQVQQHGEAMTHQAEQLSAAMKQQVESQMQVMQQQAKEFEKSIRTTADEYQRRFAEQAADQLSREAAHQAALIEQRRLAEEAVANLAASQQRVEKLEADLEEAQQARVLALETLQAAHEQGMQQLQGLHQAALDRLQEHEKQRSSALEAQLAGVQEALQEARTQLQQVQAQYEAVQAGQLQATVSADTSTQAIVRQHAEELRVLQATHARQLAEADKALEQLQQGHNMLQRQYEEAQQRQLQETEQAMTRLQVAEEAMRQLQSERDEADRCRVQLAAAEAALARARKEQEHGGLRQMEVSRQEVVVVEERLQRLYRQQLAAAEEDSQRHLKQRVAAVEEGLRRQYREQLAAAEEAMQAQQRQQLAAAEEAVEKLRGELEEVARQQEELHQHRLAKAARSKQRLRAKYEDACLQRDEAYEQLAEAEEALQRVQEEQIEQLQQLEFERQQRVQAEQAIAGVQSELELLRRRLREATALQEAETEEAGAKLKAAEEVLGTLWAERQVAEAATRKVQQERDEAMDALRAERQAMQGTVKKLQEDHELAQLQQRQQLSALAEAHERQLAAARLEYEAGAMGVQDTRRAHAQALAAVNDLVESMLTKAQKAHEARLLTATRRLEECDGRVAQASYQGQEALSNMASELQQLQFQLQDQQLKHDEELRQATALADERQRLLGEAKSRETELRDECEEMADALQELQATSAEVSRTRASEQQEVETLLRQVLDLHKQLQELSEQMDRRVDEATAAARDRATEAVAMAQERQKTAEEEAGRLRLKKRELVAEVQSLLHDMDATHGEAEACAQELMLAQDQLRAARAELHLLRPRVQEAEHQIADALRREAQSRTALEASAGVWQEQQRRDRLRADEAEAMAEQQQQLMELTVNEMRSEMQQLSASYSQKKVEEVQEVYGVVQEFRAELAALGQEVRQLAELNKAAAKRRTAEQAMPDAEQQSDLLHAKDQQQLAADQQVLRHMLSRVEGLEAAMQASASRSPLPAQQAGTPDQSTSPYTAFAPGVQAEAMDAMVPALTADASMLAAEFHRGLDEITESCKQVASVSEVLSVVEVYAAAMGISTLPPYQQEGMASSRDPSPGRALQSRAAVQAAAASAGVAEAEVEQVLSEWGVELLLGYQQVITAALSEVRRVQRLAAAALAALNSSYNGDAADAALSETMQTRLAVHQQQLDSTNERIGRALGLVHTTITAQHSLTAAAGAAAAALPYGAAATTPESIAASVSRPSPPAQEISATRSPSPLAMAPALTATSRALRGSSPPLPRQWAWPPEASPSRGPTQALRFASPGRSYGPAVSSAAASQPGSSPPSAAGRQAMSHPNVQLTSVRSGQQQQSAVSWQGGLRESLSRASSPGTHAVEPLDGAQLLERLVSRRREREQKLWQQPRHQQGEPAARPPATVRRAGARSQGAETLVVSAAAARRPLTTLASSGRPLPASNVGQSRATKPRAAAVEASSSARAQSIKQPSKQARSHGHVLGPEFGLLTAGAAGMDGLPGAAASAGDARSEVLSVASSYTASYERQQKLNRLKSMRQTAKHL